MKTIISVFFRICFFVITSNQANAAFIGIYDVNNWKKTTDLGLIDTSSAPDSISITSGNTPDPNLYRDRAQDFTLLSKTEGTVTFDWSFSSNDTDGPYWDPFGWLLNGVFTRLTDDNGSKQQSGSYSANIKVGDIFGFRSFAYDSRSGSSITVVTNFEGPTNLPPVPLPSALWLLSASLVSLFSSKKLLSNKITTSNA